MRSNWPSAVFLCASCSVACGSEWLSDSFSTLSALVAPRDERLLLAGDTGAGWADGFLNLFLPPPPPPHYDLGPVIDFGFDPDVFGKGFLTSENQVAWFSFNLPMTIDGGLGGYLIIDTAGTNLTPSNDTEIGLFDSFGLLVANDDDDGPGSLSELRFGSTSPSPDSTILSAGTYYLAVAGYNTFFGATDFSVTANSDLTGHYKLRFSTNVPEPSAGLLLILGMFAAARRRRG